MEYKIKEIVSDRSGVVIEKITLESKLKSDLDMDDLDLVELIMDCEEEFSITITDEELEKLSTVKEVLDLCSSKVA